MENADDIRQFGIEYYPAFGVLDSEGRELLAPSGETLGGVMMGKEAGDAAAMLMGYSYQCWELAEKSPPSADVIIAQLEFLRVYKELEKRDALLAKAFADEDLKASEKDCLKVYQALTLRKEGKVEDGLKLLQEVSPKLTVREATEAEAAKVDKGISPFVLARGEAVYGTVSSGADARLTHSAIVWLSGLDGDIPKADDQTPEGAQAGAVALAAVLNRPLDAAGWLEAYRAKAGDNLLKRDLALCYADGLVLAAQRKSDSAADRLIELVRYSPGRSFSPTAGVVAYETAKKGGLSSTASEYSRWTKIVYGQRLAPELAKRLK